MTKQQGSFRVFLDTWLSRIGRVVAWVWLVFWGLVGVVGLGMIFDGSPKESTDFVMPFVCLGIAALHVLLLRYIRKTNDLLGDFHVYCAAIARLPDKSIPDLAAALKQPQDVVGKRLQAMCRRGYLRGHVDFQQNRLIFTSDPLPQPQLHSVTCPGCGARSAISKAGEPCPYCGAPLNQ